MHALRVYNHKKVLGLYRIIISITIQYICDVHIILYYIIFLHVFFKKKTVLFFYYGFLR